MNFDISKMMFADVYDHPVSTLQLIETHISWVILTGDFAYKIKKPVNFGFLDFSTLPKRQHLCEQELKLNSRLTKHIYIDVVSISVQNNKLRLGSGEAIEYAIKMKQFPQSAQLDNILSEGKLKLNHMEAIAQLIASFHQKISIADNSSTFGTLSSIYQPVEENFNQITEQLSGSKYLKTLDELQQWSQTSFEHLKDTFNHRKQQGYIRECHGDLHLRNLVWIGDLNQNVKGKGPMAFDCIEFNDNLRWIDVISEIAFLVMDLHDRKQTTLANRFLNQYLQITGDYQGLAVLPFYLCYRALVRAKVAILRLQQTGIKESEKTLLSEEFESYLQLAKSYQQQTVPKLIIMRGVSASGKSTVSLQLADASAAIRLRSDVERKRFATASSTQTSDGTLNKGLYSTKVSEQTYARLLELAEQLISSGFSVIVDAAFLQFHQRQPFQQLAASLNIPYFIVQTTAPADVLRQRLEQRKHDISDADLTVLEYQLDNWKPLTEAEKNHTVSIGSLEPKEIDKINQAILTY